MPYPAYTVLPSFRPTQDRQAQRRRAGYQARHLYSCRVAAAPYPAYGSCCARHDAERPVVDIPTCATETAGAGRSPGVQGAAATGRPLCAPCAMPGITQKKYRERNLPGHNTGVLALLSAVRAGKFKVVPLFL
ncbi:hypothetical protein BME05_25575 [Klebsiella quasipneumoniae subsp. quasipneumoniae]|nr:hypothetical protein BME05_25575 [Klebsiella quasipneumoniae subsp. quasipneumoniae]